MFWAFYLTTPKYAESLIYRLCVKIPRMGCEWKVMSCKSREWNADDLDILALRDTYICTRTRSTRARICKYQMRHRLELLIAHYRNLQSMPWDICIFHCISICICIIGIIGVCLTIASAIPCWTLTNCSQSQLIRSGKFSTNGNLPFCHHQEWARCKTSEGVTFECLFSQIQNGQIMLTTFLSSITSEIQILNVLLVWNAALGFTSMLQSSSLSPYSAVSTCKCSLDIANRPTKKVHIRVWHSWKFWYEWMSEYIRINKITRMNIRIYSY